MEESTKNAASLLSRVPKQSLPKFKKRLVHGGEANFYVLPDINRNDMRYITFLSKIREFMRDTFTGSLREDGKFEGYPALKKEAERIMYAAGVGRWPLSYARHRKQQTLSPKFKEHLKMVVNVLLGEPTDDVGKITRDSNSGFPFGSNDHEFKLRHLSVISQNMDRFSDLVLYNDHKNLLDEMGVSFVSTTQVRLQTDSVSDGKPKDRELLTFENAYLAEDFSTPIPELEYNGLFTCRTRVVCAMPGLVNNMMSCVFERYKKSLLRFHKTFVHRGIEDISDKLRMKKFSIGSDIKNFDSNTPETLILEIIDLMPFTELGRSLVKKLLYGPFYCPDAYNHKYLISEDWTNESYDTWKGMPSGIFFTSVINNIQIAAVKSFIFSTYFPEILTEVGFIKYLNHELPICSLIMGDDGVDMFDDQRLYDIFANNDGYKNDYLEIVKEEGLSFLGIRGYVSNGELHFSQNPFSYFEKLYVPEKAANTYYRRYPITGLKLREDVYKDIPNSGQIIEFEAKLWKDVFNIDRDKYIFEGMRRETVEMEDDLRKIIVSEDLSNIEKEVFLDPTKIHYKYDRNDVRPEIIDKLVEKIPRRIYDTLLPRLMEV